ncbi:hypothetical protein [Algibacter mikhailovii]|nr:hypothetical protein [Algibacter mikhailovii]
MTKTDLFRVIIKIFGIYCFIDAIFQMIPNLSYSGGFYSISLKVSLIFILVTGLIAYFLLFHTDRIIKFLRLDRGFDSDNIDIGSLKNDGLFKFALIFIGLLLVVDNIPQFLNFCYLAFKKQVSSTGLDEVDGFMLEQQLDYNWWIVSALNVLMGIIILTNYRRIANLFLKKEKNVG